MPYVHRYQNENRKNSKNSGIDKICEILGNVAEDIFCKNSKTRIEFFGKIRNRTDKIAHFAKC